VDSGRETSFGGKFSSNRPSENASCIVFDVMSREEIIAPRMHKGSRILFNFRNLIQVHHYI
jgi:hypothetical protein